ncbi:MAG: MFS transporter [Candidatus Dadabacteria bacterium]|nr:MAG: MFS transporter [Candidatus Dadabacteria bacterium]
MTKTIREALFNKRMVVCLLTGFSSGLPLYVIYQLIPAWLRSEGVSLKTIGLFSIASLPYTWKFLWSPLMDRYVPPFGGRRRGWGIITQILLFAGLLCFSFLSPAESVLNIAFLVFIIAFFSASQDIVLDAYRRELLPDDELGLGNSLFINAYRFSSLVPGSLALILADHISWASVHAIVALFMGIGILGVLIAPPVDSEISHPLTLADAVIEPFKEFFRRNGVKSALLVIAFMFLYKLGDSMATALSTPFYLDLGFSKTEIGSIAKIAGLWSSVFGGFVGGLLMVKIGINRALWIFGVVQVVSILGFVYLALVGHDPYVLFAVVSFEYLGVGLGTAAFVAFIAKSTDKRFTATQFALLSSITGIPRTFANATTGYLIEAMGYPLFFLFCSVIALPGMFLLLKVAPWSGE